MTPFYFLRAPILGWLALTLMASGCLDPLADDEVAVRRSDAILPAGSAVPNAADDPAIRVQIEANDGLDTQTIPRRTGFAQGQVVKYWDFGVTTRSVLPIWRLVRADDNGSIEVDEQQYAFVEGHPAIIDAIPGDDGYSPFWRVTLVPVTAAYQGEQLTSFEAIQSAQELGLVSATVRTDIVFNCPVVVPEARLETADNPEQEPVRGYYRGAGIHYFTLGAAPTASGFVIAPQYFFRVAREGTAVMDEAVRGVDMTNDGDRLDTNNIFEYGPDAMAPAASSYEDGEPLYSPLVRWVTVEVGGDTSLIDTNMDETRSTMMAASDLFTAIDNMTGELVANPENVRAFQREEGIYHNCPIEASPESTP